MSFVFVLTCSVPCFYAKAASYEDELRSKGFPESYIQKLTQLHNKYPNWIFEPLITNMDWQYAVNGERNPHSDQLIQKCSLYDSSMYCTCSKCYVNGSYVVQEAGGWVSASEKAVEYYMDPRNWLSEEHIFQFESTAYDGTQTKAGVEAILYGTWMYDSLITYRTTSGSVKLYDSTTKYSDVIMKAANDSGMSAYYLASKIRQENGGANASASAVSGTVSPFQGIYNYYNIGAYTGASDGLAWAAGFLKLNSNSTLYSEYDSATGAVGGTATPIKSGQYMTWRANKGNYYYVRLYTESNGKYIEGASGYVLKAHCRTTYLGDTDSGLGRPWTNPYKAIYYGAKYIARSFKNQPSGYLQKFNVNPASSNPFTNEYMKNVAAASSEAVTTYNGYAKANILGITKKFVIPVFNNMPYEVVTTGLTLASLVDNNATLVWNGTYGASAYQVQILSNGQWVNYAAVPTPSLTIYGIAPNHSFTFRVQAIVPNGSSVIYGTFSNEVTVSTVIPKVTGVKASSGNNYVTLKWTPVQNASGYSVYIYDSSKKKYVYHKNVNGGSTGSVKLTKLKPNKTYKYKVLAYAMFNGTKYKGPRSSAVSIKTKNNVVTLNSAKSSKTKRITVKWAKVSGVSGYEIMWSTTSNFKRNFLSVKASSSKTSTTLKTAKSKKNYYVRVRAYKKTKSKTTYYPWSKTIKVKVK